MDIKKLTSIAAAVTLALGITACGGGGGSSTTASTVGTASVGVITGFGSVFVNGVEYETNGSSISRDGSPARESDLAVGMVVEIKGSANGASGVAQSITANDEMEGIVQANNIAPGANTGSLRIMGQTVNVNADLIFESKVPGITSVDQIAAGNIVEVHGFSDGNGNVTATRIEVKAVDLASYSDDIEVKGRVSNLDSTAMTFTLGGLTVDYSSAQLEVSGGLADGLYVEVKSQTGIVNDNLVASKVELENEGKPGHHGDEDEEFEIRGLITAGFDGTAFSIDGTRIIVDDGTELDDIRSSDLTVGTEVEVEGRFDAEGNLLADEISMEARDYDKREIKGPITAIDTSGVNTGAVTVNGSVIQVNNRTLMHDSRDNGYTPESHFNLGYLTVGDYVEVRVYTDANGDLVASKLEREDSNS